MALVGLFVTGMDREAIRPLTNFLSSSLCSGIAAASDPLSAKRPLRSDNEMLASGARPSRKGSLAMTRVSLSRISVVSETTPVPGSEEDGEISGETAEPVDEAIVTSLDNTTTTEEVQGLKIAPILRKDSRAGQLEIGNFKPMSLAGTVEECLGIGYSMLGDTNSSEDLLDVMTASDQITIAKICANNGSVVFSCRNDQITISPRRSRPDDNCPKSK